MNRDSIKDLRINYESNELLEKNVFKNPISQFNTWFDDAIKSGIREPNAMVLSTISDNKPNSRIVLLKGIENEGFVFFTNYNSQKGSDLLYNPNASLNFFWDILERQVRINGHVEKISEKESDLYFWARPKGSQIGAWVSNQSEVIENRDIIEKKLEEFTLKFENEEKIPRPPHWGGYILKPESIEFWQGRTSRLHDRLLYKLQEDSSWKLERLSP